MRQWSMLLLPWMAKKRVWARGSSDTNQYDEEVACFFVTGLLLHDDSKAAATVAAVATAVLQAQRSIPFSKSQCSLQQVEIVVNTIHIFPQ